MPPRLCCSKHPMECPSFFRKAGWMGVQIRPGRSRFCHGFAALAEGVGEKLQKSHLDNPIFLPLKPNLSASQQVKSYDKYLT